MKQWYSIAVIGVLVICLLPTMVKAEKQAQGSLACPEGLQKCLPLKEKPQKYNRCLDLLCAPKLEQQATNEKKESEQTKEKIAEERNKILGPKPEEMEKNKDRICEIGLRKCNTLRELGVRYWVCMDETCANKEEQKKDPFCSSGKAKCYKRLDEYKYCVKLLCKDGETNCVEGVESCSIPLARYWDCVSGECLGDVEKYKDPAIEKKARGEKDYELAPGRDGAMRRVYKIGDPDAPLLGVPEAEAYPPPGISKKAWESWYIPKELRVTHDINYKIECRNRASVIVCQGEHIGDCECSDGTMPMLKSDIDTKGYMGAAGFDYKKLTPTPKP